MLYYFKFSIFQIERESRVRSIEKECFWKVSTDNAPPGDVWNVNDPCKSMLSSEADERAG